MIVRRRPLTFVKTYKCVDGEVYKFCMDCEEWKPLDDEHFYSSKKKKTDPYFNVCKQCNIARSAKSQTKRREQTILYKRHWYRRNRKSEAEKAKQRYQDPEKRKRNLERAKKFREDNREYVRKYSRKRYEEGRHHKITTEQWEACKLYFDNACAYCGLSEGEHKEKYGEQLHKEHVIYLGKNDITNCVPSCKSCNSEKNTKSLHTFYNETNPNYSKNRYMKIVQWLKFGYRRV